jgi:dipeptidyl aminopeptidase/acylaminoacyl peptidase
LQQIDGGFRKLDLGDVNPEIGMIYPHFPSVGPSGQIAFIGSKSAHPHELYWKESPDAPVKCLTNYNRVFEEIELGAVKSITWPVEDGMWGSGVLIYPPHYEEGTSYPLVVQIHGGPMLTSTEAFDQYGQRRAAKGWFVFCPNYRGSNGSGMTYQSAVIKDAGAGPARDIMAGLAKVQDTVKVDDKRIALTGWSYGGFMSVWLAAHHNCWAAATAGAAVTDWIDWYALSDINVFVSYAFGGPPWGDNRRTYVEQSPITHAHGIKCPMLILANTHDERVPTTQSFKLYRALRDNKVPVKFIAYPMPGHVPMDPVHHRDIGRRIARWLEEHFR